MSEKLCHVVEIGTYSLRGILPLHRIAYRNNVDTLNYDRNLIIE